jgi:alpha-tubulin suppressor-like RCC1 family protein
MLLVTRSLRMNEASVLTPTSGMNSAPLVNAGVNQTISLPSQANLDATVTDDGNPNPPGTFTVLWELVSGPGGVTFGNANAVDTIASFTTNGVYTLKLTANDGQSSAMDQVEVTVNAAAVLNPPTAPTNLVATAVSTSAIDLSWNDTANNESGFKIERKTGSAGTYSQIAQVGANVTSYSDTGLSSATQYFYQVRASNGDGDSAYSNEANATTQTPSSGDFPISGVLAAGSYHSLGLADDGIVWAWGRHEKWELGLGGASTNDVLNATKVPGLSNVVQVAAGRYHSLTLKSNGEVWTFGENGNGELGNGNKVDASNAVPSSITGVVQVAAGSAYSLALKSNGTVWGWGTGASGQLGNGTNLSANTTPVQMTLPANAVAIAAGASHSAALLADGTVWSTGNNQSGQMGNNTTNRYALTPVPALISNVTSIAAGDEFTVALKTDGTVWTWGANGSRQLGNNSNTNSWAPVQVSNLSNVVAIAVGVESVHVLALKQDRTVWAWGSAGHGQLGYNGTSVKAVPVMVTNLTDVVSIAAGFRHSLAMTSDGTVWSWGNNAYGQLGNGTQTASPNPIRVQVTGLDLISGSTSINTAPVVNAGADQSVTMPSLLPLNATASDDGLPNPPASLSYSWSSLSPGVTFTNATALNAGAWFPSNGTYTVRFTASDGALSTSDDLVVTVNPAPTSNTAPTVNAGADQTITLPSSATLSGTASDDGLPNPPAALTYTWSHVSGGGTVTFVNGSSLNATASFSTSGTYTLRLKADDGTLFTTDDIVVVVNPVAAANVAPTVSAGADQTITLPSSASLSGTASDDGLPNPPGSLTYSWSKVSGSGTVTFSSSTTLNTTASFPTNGVYTLRLTVSDSVLSTADDIQVTVNPATSTPNVFGALAGGYGHSLGVKSDGTVWGWGQTEYGQIGVTGTPRLTAIQVPLLTSMMEVAAGRSHSAGLKSDGTVWTWGHNGYGQLGVAGVVQRTSPAAVSNLTGVTGISVGTYHTVSLKSDGTVWSWGYGLHGQMGNGTTTTSVKSPVKSNVAGVITEIAAGGYHTLALRNDGTVWSWGYGKYGQLGNGSTNMAVNAVQVSGLTGVVGLAAGEYHSLALKSNGTVWGWGMNNQGQLGNGATAVSRTTPVQVTGLSNVVQVACGWSHSMALKSDGTLWVWGNNASGQLGDGTTTRRTLPVQVGTLNSIISIAAGRAHGLALRNDGTVWTSGDNATGQLGNGTSTSSSTPVQVSGLDLITP